MIEVDKITQEDLNKYISCSLNILYERDHYLIYHKRDDKTNENGSHVSERSIVFRFGLYFDSIFRESITSFYHIDVEYNRDINDVKTLPQADNFVENKNRCPDLIVHRRGNNNHNLLVIEFKPWWNQNQKADKEKVKLFVTPSIQYKYKYGAVVLFGKQREECKIEFIRNEG